MCKLSHIFCCWCGTVHVSAISWRAWTPPRNLVQSKREGEKEENVCFLLSVFAHKLLPVLTFQTVFLCGLFHTFHALAIFFPQNLLSPSLQKVLHKGHEHTSLYKQSDNICTYVCVHVCWKHWSASSCGTVFLFTNAIPTPGIISQ